MVRWIMILLIDQRFCSISLSSGGIALQSYNTAASKTDPQSRCNENNLQVFIFKQNWGLKLRRVVRWWQALVIDPEHLGLWSFQSVDLFLMRDIYSMWRGAAISHLPHLCPVFSRMLLDLNEASLHLHVGAAGVQSLSQILVPEIRVKELKYQAENTCWQTLSLSFCFVTSIKTPISYLLQ